MIMEADTRVFSGHRGVREVHDASFHWGVCVCDREREREKEETALFHLCLSHTFADGVSGDLVGFTLLRLS